MKKVFALGLQLLFLAVSVAWGAQSKALEIGDKAPDFDLPGVDDKNYKLSDFAEAKALAVVFTCNHCPTAQAYELRLIKMRADYKDKGVAFVAISPNDPYAVRLDELGYSDLSDSFEEMKIRAKERGFTFPYLYDGDKQDVSRAYGVLATPHMFVFDQERKLRYAGRIDDGEVTPVKSHDARNAIEALLADKSVPVEKTRVFGCSTKWSDKRNDAKRALAAWEAEPVELKDIDPNSVMNLAKNNSNKLRLINVWATWCGPCVAELPDLVNINRMYRNRDFEMITISMDTVDRKDRALAMLKKLHVSCVNYIYAHSDKDKLVEALDKEWQGPVPHTVLIAPGGTVIYRHTGQIDALDLKKAIVERLGRTY